MAYDNPIPGFDTNNTINLRLWAAKPDTEFDLEAFNTGDYVQVGDLALLTADPAHCVFIEEAPFLLCLFRIRQQNHLASL